MSNVEILEKVRAFKELQEYIKQLEDEASAIKAALTEHLDAQQTDSIKVDVFTVKYTAYTSSRIDTTTLRKELPEVAARYTKTTEARRFSIA